MSLLPDGRRRWVLLPENRARVVEMRRAGASIDEIAAAMGHVGTSGVRAHLRLHGDQDLLRPIARRPAKRPEWWDKAAQLYRAGLRPGEIAYRLGHDTSSVSRVLRGAM